MQLADVLAELHGLDVDAVGLGDFARREGYIDRQIARWSKQWDGSKTREPARRRRRRQAARRSRPAAAGRRRRPRRLPLRQLHHRSGHGRDQGRARLGAVHARRPPRRRRLRRRPLGADGRQRRPPQRPDRRRRVRHATTTSSSATPSAVAATSRTSTSTSRFQLWRTAIILEGVYARYLGGAYGGQQLGAELDVLRDAPDRAHRAGAAHARPPAMTLRDVGRVRRRRHRVGSERARRRDHDRPRRAARARRRGAGDGRRRNPQRRAHRAGLRPRRLLGDPPPRRGRRSAAHAAARSPRAALDPAARTARPPARRPLRAARAIGRGDQRPPRRRRQGVDPTVRARRRRRHRLRRRRAVAVLVPATIRS